MERCENCGGIVGNLETPYVWRDKVVCVACHQRLSTNEPSLRAARTRETPPLIAMACVNCGGKVEIAADGERFTCQYCGTELVAQRSGGVVFLKRVLDLVQKIQIGTDRAATELEVARLERELAEYRNTAQELDRNWSDLFWSSLPGMITALFCLPMKIHTRSGLAKTIEAKEWELIEKKSLLNP
jgi:DNA-directed RNA polymerase subunit RPC12/RpoP